MEEALTFEKVWAALMENREQMKDTDARMKETDRLLKETREQIKKTDEQMKKTDEKFGHLGNRFGELVEHLVAPSINEKFNELGYTFTLVHRNSELKISPGRTLAEIDIMLENGDVIIAVSVKAKPLPGDVDKHIAQMAALRQNADRKQDTRIYRGAIAGAIMSKEIRDSIIRAGFYAIEQTGDTVHIYVPDGFVPKDW